MTSLTRKYLLMAPQKSFEEAVRKAHKNNTSMEVISQIEKDSINALRLILSKVNEEEYKEAIRLRDELLDIESNTRKQALDEQEKFITHLIDKYFPDVS